jgi:hypothetical protein
VSGLVEREGENREVLPRAIRDMDVAAWLRRRRGPVGETGFPPRDGAAAWTADAKEEG